MFYLPRCSAALVVLCGALTITATAVGGHAAESKKSGDLERSDDLSAVTSSLKASARAYIEVRQAHCDPGVAIPVRVIISPVSGADMAAGRLKGNWERMAKALAAQSVRDMAYTAVVTAYDADDRTVVWKGEQPIDPEPLAKAARELVSDESVFSRMDPPATLRLEIPGEKLKPAKRYRIALSFRDPEGTEQQFDEGSTPEAQALVIVRAAPLDLAKLHVPYQVIDSAEMLKSAEEIANPGRRQFPGEDADNCQARSIWCLRPFQGRIYLGYGDWAKNRGPIALWSFAADSDPQLAARYGRYAFSAGTNPRMLFTQEYLVQEHSIERYHVWGDRLVLPGIDGLKEAGPDGIAFANIYIREKGAWRKLSSLSRSVHVMDATGVGDRLFAMVDRIGDSPGGIVVSQDSGLSWTTVAPDDGELIPFSGGLLVLSGQRASVYTTGNSFKSPSIRVGEFTPGSEPDLVHRATPFQNGVVYTTWDSWGRSQATQHPLFFLSNLAEGPRLVGPFHDRNVRDLFVEGQDLFVLTGRTIAEREFEGEVFATRDLRHWTRRASFRVPALPNSLAALAGEFYIGLANRGFDPDRSDDLKPTRYHYADAASGGIYRMAK